MRIDIPRFMIAAPSSGSGKSTIASGVMAALAASTTVQPFKVGPDYIDPMYHTTATGRASRNLDTWMVPPDRVRAAFARAVCGADIAIIEGVMGLFDGFDGKSENGSSAEVAKLLGAPVVLVIDVGKMARSAGAIALGCRLFDPDLSIAGVICNRVGNPHHAAMVTHAVEATGLPVLGCIPKSAALAIPERHLGLHTAVERSAEVAEFLQAARALVSSDIDLERLRRIAETAPVIDLPLPPAVMHGSFDAGVATFPPQIQLGHRLFTIKMPALLERRRLLRPHPRPLSHSVGEGSLRIGILGRRSRPKIRSRRTPARDSGVRTGSHQPSAPSASPYPQGDEPLQSDPVGRSQPVSQPQTLAGAGASPAGAPGCACTIRIAIARDEASCFYYEDNLDLLRSAGAEIDFFSPLRDGSLPPDVTGIYLGGGYPELYAAQLSANQAIRREIRENHRAGMPIYAECGGLMYLTEGITSEAGEDCPMVGLLPGRTRLSRRLTMGYRTVMAEQDTLLLLRGEEARGHEFHYSEWMMPPDDLPSAYRIARRQGTDVRSEGYAFGNLLASYVHLHFDARPGMAERFVAACRRWVGEFSRIDRSVG